MQEKKSNNARRGGAARKRPVFGGSGGGRPPHKNKGRSGGGRPNGGRGGRSGGGRGGRGPKKQSIHPSKFINKAVERVVEVYEPKHTFDDFILGDKIKGALRAHGYSTPTAIQDQAIPLALEGSDVIGLANTGTGKTVAFLLPILEKRRTNPQRDSVLIVAPTRELAQQIHQEFLKFARSLRLYGTVCVGGANIDRQIRELKRHPHVIIGTPGRLKDLLSRNALDLSGVDTFVLDEADRMLDMGFLPDIRAIEAELPKQRQTLCLSATMTPDIMALVHDFMRNPETVSVRTGETSDHVEQDVVEYTDPDDKHDKLHALLNNDEFEKVVVFGETKYGVQRLADKLSKTGVPAEAIHGNKSQSQRQRALRSFKNEHVKVLIATDVAARGLDIPDVTHVINFDTPQTYDDYVHRIGRTGRGGKTGNALTFVKQYRR